MKVSITLDNFPMLLFDMMVQDLQKRIGKIDIQVGGVNTVFITFFSDDIVKVQEICIIIDKYNFGGDGDGSEILCDNEKQD